LPDQVVESLVSFDDFLATESLSKLLYSDVTFLNAVDIIYAIEKLLKVHIHFAFVLFKLFFYDLLIV
jgi:hypothetical protein